MTRPDELTPLRQLLEAFRSEAMTVWENDQDVTEREMAKLKADIAGLESRLHRQPDHPARRRGAGAR
ncbi:MAG TPA: hypothetical protein VHZ26_08960 [Caulobacteraceae bacterium]|jgi:hypothetical protein|nr:hypothetical protein [Caulobacteraceae bacterium]